MNWTFSVTPLPYGFVHFAILLGTVLAVVLSFIWMRRARGRTLERVLFWIGVCMLVAEAWKQWFVMRYVYEAPSMWFFPWQLCSMAMYCSALVPFLKGRVREAVLVFLCTYSPVGAIFAMLFPQDMMRPQILLFMHSFLYHAVMLVEAAAALHLLRRSEKPRFLPALALFLCMAAVAEGINALSHWVFIRNIHYESNMFYITPFYPSTQPVFSAIAEHAGIGVEILAYLVSISLGAYLLYLLGTLWLRRKKRAQ